MSGIPEDRAAVIASAVIGIIRSALTRWARHEDPDLTVVRGIVEGLLRDYAAIERQIASTARTTARRRGGGNDQLEDEVTDLERASTARAPSWRAAPSQTRPHPPTRKPNEEWRPRIA